MPIPTPEKLKRFAPVMRFGGEWLADLEPATEGEWVKWAEVDALLVQRAQAIQDLESQVEQVCGDVRACAQDYTDAKGRADALEAALTARTQALDQLQAERDTYFQTISDAEDAAEAAGFPEGKYLAEVIRELADAARVSRVPQPPCVNCGHVNPHDGPAGDVADACTHPGCNCGYYSPVSSATQQEQDIISQCEDHWFVQGGESRFGALSHPDTPDELIAQILARVRPKCAAPLPASPAPKDVVQQIAALIREWVQSEWELREFSEITVDDGQTFKFHALALAQFLEPRLAAALWGIAAPPPDQEPTHE